MTDDEQQGPPAAVPPPAGPPASPEAAAAAVAAATTMTAALEALEQRLTSVVKWLTTVASYGRRSRRLIVATIISLALDVVLTGVLAVVAVQSHEAVDRSHAAAATIGQLHAAQVAGCQAGNEQRAQELALWTYLFRASKPGTPAQQAQVAAFMRLVQQTFAPRDCAKAYAITGPGG